MRFIISERAIAWRKLRRISKNGDVALFNLIACRVMYRWKRSGRLYLGEKRIRGIGLCLCSVGTLPVERRSTGCVEWVLVGGLGKRHRLWSIPMVRVLDEGEWASDWVARVNRRREEKCPFVYLLLCFLASITISLQPYIIL
jgi:hypothetical protein